MTTPLVCAAQADFWRRPFCNRSSVPCCQLNSTSTHPLCCHYQRAYRTVVYQYSQQIRPVSGEFGRRDQYEATPRFTLNSPTECSPRWPCDARAFPAKSLPDPYHVSRGKPLPRRGFSIEGMTARKLPPAKASIPTNSNSFSQNPLGL
jgi:hypothetical protein